MQQLIHRGPSSQNSKVFTTDDRTLAMLGTARLANVGVNNGVSLFKVLAVVGGSV